jgi:hypothetical protein
VQRLLEGDFIVGYMSAVGPDARKHERLVFVREEVAVFGKWGNDGPAGHANENGDAALDDKDPANVSAWIAVSLGLIYHLHAPYPAVPSILAMSDETKPLIAPATIPAVQKKTYRVRYSRFE